MLRLLLLPMLLACACTAAARDATGTREDVRNTIEASLLVTGTIDIGTDGVAVEHRLDQPEKLPELVRDLVARTVREMRFEPVLIDNKPVKVRARMGMRVVARQLQDGGYQLRVAATSFGDAGEDKAERVVRDKLQPPEYPAAASMRGIRGTVYLVLKIDRQGAVQDLAVEQVNLTIVRNERQMQRAREWLASASLDAARHWTFRIPTRGEAVDDPFWEIRIPIDFKSWDHKDVAYGQWEAYVPGPRMRPSWIDPDEAPQDPDAMIAGSLYQAGKGPRLQRPVDQG